MTGDPAPDRSDTSSQQKTHYSYTAYADPAMADRFDRMRFSGPIGMLIAENQEQVLVQFCGDVSGMGVLDVGTGTGRAALALARKGARVTAVDASAEMLRVARERATASGLDVAFEQADAHHLPFEDRRFVVVVSLRVLMHTPDWRVCLRELCRVSSERVVFDYPAAASLAVLQSAARRVLRAAGRQVEAYRVLRLSDVKAVLRSCGYRLEREHRQFVLPIAFHKAIGSRAFTIGIERVLAAAGLLRFLGSPVTLLAVRCES